MKPFLTIITPLALVTLTFAPPAHAQKDSKMQTSTSVQKTINAQKVVPKIPQWKISAVASPTVQSFDLADVTLLDSPFKHAMDKDAAYLLSLEPDRFLHGFRKEAGLEPKAPIYGGWENAGVAGHAFGHYMSAMAMLYRATGDERIKERLSYVIDQLAEVQKANGDGYVGAIPEGKRIWGEIRAGDVRGTGFDLNGGWVPWYTMHKVFAGLRDVYRFTGNEKAKTVLLGLSDWALDLTKNLDDAQWQNMLAAEHGGMNEVLADVYAITGEKKYLDLSEKFFHRAILEPLAAQKDQLAGQHANTQIPKVIGTARLYELTGDQKDGTIAQFFWNAVVNDHSYVIGGNSDHEHFGQPDKLVGTLSTNTTETCNTYNMLKLTEHLFERTPQIQYADFYERALYNHILSSINPDSGMTTYYVPLVAGGARTYGTPTDSFWCCTGTGMENHVKYGEAIYFHSQDTLYVNGFIPSILRWEDKGLTIRQDTQYPESELTKLTITTAKPTQAALKIRCPGWLASDAQITVNGKKQDIATRAGSYATLDRTWKSGDTIEIRLPMQLTQETFPDDKNKVAFLYGPVVLAGDLGKDARQIPMLLTKDKPLNQWLLPVVDEPLTFRPVEGAGAMVPEAVTLKPFYAIPTNRYMVYWDQMTPAQWQERKAQIEAEEAAMKARLARTIDEVRFGEQQPEVDHALKSENSSTGRHQEIAYRHTGAGGWFEVQMRVLPDAPMELACRFWGSENGAREFDITVDGKTIATPSLAQQKPNEFYIAEYPIPVELTRGKTKVTVRYQAKPGNIAGGVFGSWMLKAE